MASTLDLLKQLNECGVEYVLVGGVAAVVHGSQLVTGDVDVCAPLDEPNLARIVAALLGLQPKFRLTPDRHPLPSETSKLAGFKNLYLETDLGQLDLLSEITGVGTYAEVSMHAISIDLGGITCQVLDLDALIQSKQALGRPRDRQAVIELEAIRQRLKSERQ
jgi:predicted nucleotidyltransferase